MPISDQGHLGGVAKEIEHEPHAYIYYRRHFVVLEDALWLHVEGTGKHPFSTSVL